MTVHRDLDTLHGEGSLTKDRGRAVAPSAVRVETSALFRLRAARQVKDSIARKAVARLAGVRMLGGSYDRDLQATFGTACTDSIARWRADVAMVSVPALRDGHCFPPSVRAASPLM
jgi:DeoR/GlpR family transcriptional regulator of sugar metabolism